MIAYVIVEGESDVQLLQHLVPADLQQNVSFIAPGGRAYVSSMARTLLSSRGKPLAVVVPAHSVHHEVIQDLRQILQDLLGFAAPASRFKVIVAVPEIESVFFEAASVLPRMFGVEPSAHLLELAVRDPCGVLQKLDDASPVKLSLGERLKLIDEQDLQALNSTALLRTLDGFLQQAHDEAAASVRT